MPHQFDAYAYEINVSFMLAVPQGQDEPTICKRETYELIHRRLAQVIEQYAREMKLACMLDELDVMRIIANGDTDWSRVETA